jgi:mRNA deadenylase 3'-5' endonuclease subunit Ccr4
MKSKSSSSIAQFKINFIFSLIILTSTVIISVTSFSASSSSDMIRTSTSVDTMMKLRVVSYNVLSSHLASPSYFTNLNPEHLDASNRLKVVLQKLEAEIPTSDNAGTTIFALQEVSYDWAGALHTFFSNRGYHLITGLYGKRHSGYMGKYF